MSAAADSQITSDRFAEYVAEFREFSASHHLPYGYPADLSGLLHQLNHHPGFRSECASMLRAVFYREHGAAPPEELLMLLIVAWGGQPSGPPTPTLQAIVTELLRFTVGVMRTPVLPPEYDSDDLSPTQPPPDSAAGPLHDPADQPSPDAGTSAKIDSLDNRPTPHSPSATAQFLPGESSEPQHQPATELDPSAAAAIAEIDAAIQLLAIRSPDVKRYLQLLRDREALAASHPHITLRAPAPRPSSLPETTPTPSSGPAPNPAPAPTPAPAPGLPVRAAVHIPPHPSPWDHDSEFQVELRQFAAQREARLLAWEARHRPASSKLADAAESAWHRLADRWRHS